METQDSRLSGILRNRKKLPEMSSDSSYAVRFRRSPSVISEPDSAEKKEIELLVSKLELLEVSNLELSAYNTRSSRQ